jgi:glutathione peroxidase
MSTSFFDLKPKAINGSTVDLSAYKGKKIVVLNTASECGYTPQYADWQEFYEANKDKVVVLGFPANDFGAQEPGSNEAIAQFCQVNFGVTFPMMEKISVLGEEQHPVYQWLTKKELNGWNSQQPTWNFCKYIVDEQGRLTHFFQSSVTPDNSAFKDALGIK